ncbi:hypothetical protein BS47DRAFT_335192 [Hydnum rufescens UP504]|uniref:Uncharacterized protein n=1 Tax=Hydnum rufescens UP504 TaxID=1448309 RepID=A0A9P6B8Q0_9AGAM|nr:hypothetical protein BS47DRAFT_335192 [Hydnum rufescens UP504]
MKAGVPYQLFPSHPIERSKSGAIEGSDEDNQTQDRPSSVPDSDTSYDMEEGDRDESDVHSAVISSRRAQYARYTSEERRDMVMHLVANPATNWVNYSSKYTSRTPMSLFSYHRRHPSLDREAAELARHQKLNQDNRGGWDVAFLSEAACL